MNTKTKIRIADKGFGEKDVLSYRSHMPNQVADLALVMIQQSGLTAGIRGKEDSAGRAHIDLLPAQETVTRAFDLAEMAYKLAEERGLMVEMPDLNDINAANDARLAARKAEEDSAEDARRARERERRTAAEKVPA